MKYLILLSLLSSCAVVHHVQVGDIESKRNYVRMPFEMKVSETGIDFQQAGNLTQALAKNQAGNQVKQIADIIALFQMGPITGNPIFNEKYADGLAKSIYTKCPSGNITGLVMIRETAKYPVVSGEIMKIKGYCLQKKTKRKNKRNS
jgi:hypothetical protein